MSLGLKGPNVKAKLTARTVTTLGPQDKPYRVFDTEIPGFYLRVQPTGATTWRYFYRNAEGRQRDCRIGTGLTPSHARVVARDLHAAVAQGRDPVAEREAARAQAERRRQRTPWIPT